MTHVVIPKQSAGPDFIDMENVEELFSFQDQQNLLTLGWIHTADAAVEAIAIAWAPQTQRNAQCCHTHMLATCGLHFISTTNMSPLSQYWCVFRLTVPGCRRFLAADRKGFHPHPRSLLSSL
ncbi:AMSH-like protease isoform X1 [Lates japonicus]|uniref:AMSH-like protease isoform X1 n=1 Tax=Lates japonicus TaxID=270547 RepID=A0AAD3RLA5_LATJO|nr:AMSH-like protease isoform X1 [Lates japonicus]